MNIKIREATFDDIDTGLLKVFIEGYRFHQNGRPDIFVNVSDEVLKENLIDSLNKQSVILIEVENVIAGYLAYQIKERQTKKLEVEELVVLEQFRGKGLGKALMNEAKSIAKKNSCNRIELNCWMFNTNALAMYEHIGFDRQRIIYEMKI